jgi:methyl-accepting chemotaxis protein
MGRLIMNIRDIRIGQRLSLGFGLVITLLVLLAALALIRIRALAGEVQSLAEVTYPRTVIANTMKADLNEVSRSMLSTLVMSDADQIKDELAKIEKYSQHNDQQMAELKKSITDPEGQKLLASITKLRDKSAKAQKAFVGMINENLKEDAMTKFLFSIRPVHTKYRRSIQGASQQHPSPDPGPGADRRGLQCGRGRPDHAQHCPPTQPRRAHCQTGGRGRPHQRHRQHQQG